MRKLTDLMFLSFDSLFKYKMCLKSLLQIPYFKCNEMNVNNDVKIGATDPYRHNCLGFSILEPPETFFLF